jgi:putative hydrolase of the HAD superfamily
MIIKTVVFDLDDTLFSERHFALSGYRAAHEWQLPRLGLQKFFEVAQELYASENRERLFDRALEKLGAATDPATVAEMVRIFREHLPTSLQLHEDAKWALDYFKSRGKTMAVISDGYVIPQSNKVKVLNLEPYFKRIIYSDTLGGPGFWKPHPLPFQRIMEEFPGEPGSYVYIADNPIKDFIAPKSLGWQTIHVERPINIYYQAQVPKEHRADRVVGSLRELEGL